MDKSTKSAPASAAVSLESAGDNAAYDANAKNLLAHRIFLAWILHWCVREFADIPVEQIAAECIRDVQVGKIPVAPGEKIVGENTEDAPPGEGIVRFDIRFTAIVPGEEEEIALVVNVEMQKDSPKSVRLEKRTVVYAARLLGSQVGTVFSKGEYEKARKVYTIWICANSKNEKKNKKEVHRLCQEGDLCSRSGSDSSFDLLSIVMLYLGDPNEAHAEPILRLLDVIFSSAEPEKKIKTLEQEFKIPMTRTIKTEVKEMGGMGQAIYENGVAQGVAEGVALGMISMGRIAGFSDEKISEILVAKLDMEPEVAMAFLHDEANSQDDPSEAS